MAFLPEGFDYIAESKEDSLSLAEALDGDTISAYRSIARESSIALSLGGFHRRSDVAGKTRNTHVVIDERGEVASTYQKCHLFDVDIPEKNIRLKKSASRSSCADEASFATIALSGHQQCRVSCGGIGFSALPFRSFYRSVRFKSIPFRSFYHSVCCRSIPFRSLFDRN